MVTELWGRDAVLDGLIPRMTGLDPAGNRRVKFEFPAGGPVVRLVGDRSAGKTAVLDVLYDRYNSRVPLVQVDLAAAGFGEPGLAELAGEESANSSPIIFLLYLLSYKLGLRVQRFSRPLEFPRLSLGLLVVSAWRTETAEGGGNAHVHPSQLRNAEERLRTVIAEDHPDQRRRKELLRQWFDALSSALPTAITGLPALDAMVGATLATARDQLLAPRPDRGALHWWGEHLTAFQGNDLQRLFSFVRDFRRYDDGRRGAEELLVTAFLDDIGHHYGIASRLNQVPRPLILADNVHTPLGVRFIDLLLGGLERASGSVRPVVVTTAMGDPDDHPPIREAQHATLWETPTAGAPAGHRVLSLGIPALAVSDVVTMLSRVDYPPNLPQLIVRLTGGRAGGVRVLTDAAVERLRDGISLRDAELLSLPAPPDARPLGGTVEDALLRRLLPDPTTHSDLILLSATLDDSAARRVWISFHSDDGATARVRAAKDALTSTSWRPAPWPGCTDGTPFVTDRPLRGLLLHRLRTQYTGERWNRVHLRLGAGYNPHGLRPHDVGHSVLYLHHLLALGESETVVRCLHHRLASDRPADWLAALNVICAAPRPPEGVPPPFPDAVPRACEACPSSEVPPVHRAVDRLVRILWERADALAALPGTEEIAKVESALNTLYEQYDETDVFLLARNSWPTRLRAGAQAPDLPIPQGARP